MRAWVMAALAWLAGVAWQTQQANLWPRWAYVLGTLGCATVVVAAAWCAWRRSCLGVHRASWPARAMWLTVLVMPCVAGLAWMSTGWRAADRMAEQLPAAWHDQVRQVVVQVVGLPRASSEDAVFDAQVMQWVDTVAPQHGLAAQGSALPSLISVRMRRPASGLPRAGQRWQLHVRLHAPDSAFNPGGHDATLAYFERGVRALARVPSQAPAPLKLRDMPVHAWQGWIDRMRQDVRDAIFAGVSDRRAAGVLAGLAVGDQSAIEREDWGVFRDAGLGHVVAISGTHIAMLGWLGAWLSRRWWSRWRLGMHLVAAPALGLWAGVLFSVFYALVAGWGVPAQRTVWMMIIVALLRTGLMRWSWPMVWLFSAVILTCLDPWCLHQPGFWLSYVAVGVLMSAGLSAESLPPGVQDEGQDGRPGAARVGWPHIREGVRRCMGCVFRALVALLGAQWLVTRALMPLILVCFGQVSLIGFVANLVAIPLFTLAITPLALFGMVYEPAWLWGAWLIQETMGVLAALAALPYATSHMPQLPAVFIVPAVLAGWSLAWRMSWTWRWAVWPFALVLLYLPQSFRILRPPDAGQVQLLAADVGQGTAVLLRTRHHTLLFDAGPRTAGRFDAGERILLPLVRAVGITSLDALIISHEDTDHVGGAPMVLRHLPVSRLMSSLGRHHPLRALPDGQGRAVPHTACEAGLTWMWDGVRFEFLHPLPENLSERAASPRRIKPNAVSCVLHVKAEGGSALITGDIGHAEEAAILARASRSGGPADATSVEHPLQSTVLMAPHHGSRTSSSEAFLRAINPRQVVIQAGRRNAYGHPATGVIQRYEALKLPWLWTPDCGAYVWQSQEASPPDSMAALPTRGLAATGRCWRQMHRRYWHGTVQQGASSSW